MNLWLRLIWALLSWRSRGPLSIWDVCVRTFRVWPTDLDIFNHMNNGKYGSLMDLSRFDLWLRSGTWKECSKRGWYPVIVAETLTFRKSLAPWQKFEMESKVVGWDAEAFYVDTRFTVNGEIYTQTWARLRFLQRPRGIVTPAQFMEVFGVPTDGRQVPAEMLEWAASVALPKGKEPAPSNW